MNLDHLPSVTATKLLWREQLAALPRALWYALGRLLRQEPRYYLMINDQVVARFVSAQDHLELLNWLAATHTTTLNYGYQLGGEVVVAHYAEQQADAGDAGTS